jgi:hypothetical protein
MHADLARAHPVWDDRIEVVDISAGALARCRTHPTTVAVISPGEHFHLVEAGTRPASMRCGCSGSRSTS